MRIRSYMSEDNLIAQIKSLLMIRLPESFVVKPYDRFFDIVVYKDDALYAIFEIDISNQSFDDVVKRKKTYDFFKKNKLCRFYILARQNRFEIVEKKDFHQYNVYDEEELIRHLMSNEEDFYYDDNEQIIRKVLLENNLSEFMQDIRHSHQAHYCFFDEETTNRFFLQIVRTQRTCFNCISLYIFENSF